MCDYVSTPIQLSVIPVCTPQLIPGEVLFKRADNILGLTEEDAPYMKGIGSQIAQRSIHGWRSIVRVVARARWRASWRTPSSSRTNVYRCGLVDMVR